MRKQYLILVLIFIFVIKLSYAQTYTQDYNNFLTRSIGDRIYCLAGGDCNMSNLVVENLTVLGDFFNVTVINYNVTGNIQISGNVSADYYYGDGSFLIGTGNTTAEIINSSAYFFVNRSGDRMFGLLRVWNTSDFLGFNSTRVIVNGTTRQSSACFTALHESNTVQSSWCTTGINPPENLPTFNLFLNTSLWFTNNGDTVITNSGGDLFILSDVNLTPTASQELRFRINFTSGETDLFGNLDMQRNNITNISVLESDFGDQIRIGADSPFVGFDNSINFISNQDVGQGNSSFAFIDKMNSEVLFIIATVENGTATYVHNSFCALPTLGLTNSSDLENCVAHWKRFGVTPLAGYDTKNNRTTISSFDFEAERLFITNDRGQGNVLGNGIFRWVGIPSDDFDVYQTKLHLRIDEIIEVGKSKGDNIIRLNANFDNLNLTPFNNENTPNDWEIAINGLCPDVSSVACVIADDNCVSGSTCIINSTFSTLQLNETKLGFWLNTIDMGSGGDFEVTVANSTSEVSLYNLIGTDVIDTFLNFSFPQGMDNKSKITVRFYFTTSHPIRGEVGIDRIISNGTLTIASIQNVTVENAEIEFGNGACYIEKTTDENLTQQINIVCPKLLHNGVAINGTGGSGTSDHASLTNLEWSNSGHTFLLGGQTMDIGSYDFTTTGDLFVGGTSSLNWNGSINTELLVNDSLIWQSVLGNTSKLDLLKVDFDNNVTKIDSTLVSHLLNVTKIDILRIDLNNNVTKIDTTWSGLVGNASKLDNLILGNTTQQMIDAVNTTGFLKDYNNSALNGTRHTDVNALKISGTTITGIPITPGLVLTSTGSVTATWQTQAAGNVFRFWNDSFGGEGRATGIDTMNLISRDSSIIVTAENGAKTKDNLTFAYNYSKDIHNFTTAVAVTNNFTIRNGEYLVPVGGNAFCADGFPLACESFNGGVGANYGFSDTSGNINARIHITGAFNGTRYIRQVMGMLAVGTQSCNVVCGDLNGLPEESNWNCTAKWFVNTRARGACSDTTSQNKNCQCTQIA